MPVFNIDFFHKDVLFPLENKKKIKKWLIQLAEQEKKDLAEIDISIVFCDDKYLLSLNKQYLNKSTLTDILSFDYSEKKILRGDIFISIDRIIENAKEYSQVPEKELLRIMAHGMLHLCGYADKTKKEKKQMTAMEDFYLLMIK
jgi:probable rRNA maturation factor